VSGDIGNPTSRTGWVPLEGRWEEPADAKKLKNFLRADASLGIGLRLGGSVPGRMRLVDILIKDREEAAPALGRIFGPKGHVETTSWLDEEGTHCVFSNWPSSGQSWSALWALSQIGLK
jgi:hypothetical protein